MMKQTAARVAALLIAACLMIAGLTACERAVTGTDEETTAVVLEGENYSLEELKLYIYASQYDVEKLSEQMILYMYGDYEKFWENEENGRSYYELNYSEGANRVLQTKRLLKKAAELGITLSAEDEAKVQETIAAFKAERAAVLEASGATDELLDQFIHENALAVKTYLALVEDVDTNFDYEEFTRKKAEGLFVTAASEKETESAAESESTEEAESEAVAETYSEEEQTAVREKVAAEVLERLEAGDTVEDIVAAYTDDPTVRVVSTGTMTITPDDKAEEGAEPDDYRALAWNLKTGECGMIDNTASNGTITACVIRSVNDDDPELRKTAEETELVQRKMKLFSERYAELAKQYGHFHVYESTFPKIKKVIPMYESTLQTQLQSAQ